MASGKDWIPKGVKEFDDFQTTFCLGVNTNVVSWHITTSKNTTLQELNVIYADFYAISKEKATAKPIDYDNTDEARVNLKANIRLITKQEIKNNSNMTDTERTSIGVPNEAKAPVDAPVATVAPAIGYQGVARLVGKYTFTPKKKPAGQGGYRIRTGFYKAGDPVPTEDQCTQSDVITGESDLILYNVVNLGMQFVSYTRYVNTAKKVGLVATVFNGIVS
jgi:hypothetical protein